MTPPEEHPVEELPALVDGRLPLAEVRRVVSHARTCPACQGELVEMVAGSAALRYSPSSDSDVPSILPPPGFLDRLDDRPLASVGASDSPASMRGGAEISLLRRRRGLVGIAAAIAAAIGITVGLLATQPSGHSGAPIALSPVRSGDATGSIKMAGGGADQTMVVTTTLPPPKPGTYYEVWLLREQTNAMVPVGVLPSNGQANYVLPVSLIASYNAVDISVQIDNGSTAHSHDSVLRARYA